MKFCTMVELQTQSPPPTVHAKCAPALLPQLSTTPSTAIAGATATSAPIPLMQRSAARLRNQPKTDSYTSPVNQNGSFEFDRVIKSGYLQKRTKTKTWRTIFLVLRPNTLSIYKSEKEDKLRYQIFLSELTAVTFLKDPKQKRQHVFGLFSPSRNYHLQANTAADAQEWVDRIRTEARIEEEEEEMFLASPVVHRPPGAADGESRWRRITAGQAKRSEERERMGSSSPEPQVLTPRKPQKKDAQNLQNSLPESSGWSGWSGNELPSSDCSDGDMHMPALGMSFESLAGSPRNSVGADAARPLGGVRNISQASGIGSLETDPDRVVWQGWLWILRSKGGVRQWKNSWAVLRPRNLILYKDESEYAAQFIVSLSSIVNVVERDPMSRSKQHCLEIITEEKSYRFAAHDEETLLQCLGTFKSLLAKRRELETRAAAAAEPATAAAAAAAA